MAFFDATTDRTSDTATTGTVLSLLLAPFRAFGNLLVSIAENNSRMEQVRRLQELSDEDLAAADTTRADEVRRIFASSGAL